MKICSAIVILTFAVSSWGCGGSETATSAERDSTGTTRVTAAEKAGHPVPKAAPGGKPLEKLVIKNLELGDGQVAHWGDQVTVRYVGVYYRTGKSYSQHWGSTFSLELDGKTIGPGWQKGIHGMREGGRREILIPSRLIWHGADGDIAYVLELVNVKTNAYPQEGAFAAIILHKGKKKPSIDPPDRPPPRKVLIRDLDVGAGPPARDGDEANVYFAGAEYKTGKIRFYGWRPFPPAGVLLGSRLWGKAWEEGIEGMRAGGRREVIIPSRALGGSPAVDYMIEVMSLKQDAER